MSDLAQDIDYCRAHFRDNNYAQYIVSLLMPLRFRPALWAMGAVTVTIDQIPHQVSEPTLGYIRLSWWRDQINAIGKGPVPKGQPILAVLEQKVGANISNLLVEYINAQEVYFENGTRADLVSAYPAYEAVLGKEYPRFVFLQNYLTFLYEKYAPTRWKGYPPFLVVRLWWASTTYKG